MEENKVRARILREAEKLICEDRNKQYGEPEGNLEVVAGFWTAYIGAAFDAHDVAVMMALYKIARIATAPEAKADNYIDAAGYLGIAGEIAYNA